MNICKICDVLTPAKKDKQELIYNAAVELFKSHGPKKVSVDMIVKEAGVGKGTFYNYYKNKEDLYEQIFDFILSNGQKYMRMLVEKYPDPKERFMVDLINSLNFFCDRTSIIWNIMEGNPDYFIGKINEDYLEETHEKMLRILFSDSFDELFGGDRCILAFGKHIFMFYKHAQKMKPTFKSDEEFKDFMARLAKFMVEGIFNDWFKEISAVKYSDYEEQVKPFDGMFKFLKKY